VASVTILRELWRHRAAVCALALLALAVGWLLAFGATFPPKSRSYTIGVASASVLVDTPKSQVVEVAPKGSETLGSRASVLANLMVDGDVKDAIAHRAGLSSKELVATATAGREPAAGPALNARSHALTTSVVVTSDLADLPIIRVQTQAPDVASAIKLANGAVAGLSSYLDSKAAAQTVSATRRLRVRALGLAQGHEAARGMGRLMSAAVAILVLVAGCAAILGLSALVRGWRSAVASERQERWLQHAEVRNAPARPQAEKRASERTTTKLRA
jgi:hypothetical protein